MRPMQLPFYAVVLSLGCAQATEQEILSVKPTVDSGAQQQDTTPITDTATPSCEGKPGATCKPGETRESKCGFCGKVLDTCDLETCTWAPGTCSGEGPCEPGTFEDVPCATTGEFKRRTCTDACAWGEYAACAVTKPWTAIAPTPTGFEARYNHTAVWTGTEMIVWGGKGATAKKDGAAYDPAKNTWRMIAPAPATFSKGRTQHSAAWTGSKMIVWGGLDNDFYYGLNGAAYDPTTDTWTEIKASPLSGRTDADAIWLGSELLIWGGSAADGATYNPTTDTWTMLPAIPLSARAGAKAVWNGSALVVWSGCPGGVVCSNDGATYDPTTKAWTKMATPPTNMDGRFDYVAIASGPSVFFWGGYGGTESGNLVKKTGAMWAPTTGWKSMSLADTVIGPNGGRQAPLAWVVGGKLYVFSGLVESAPYAFGGGGIYDPATDKWTALPTLDAPAARVRATVVWTGSEAIVWGGAGFPGSIDTYLRDGARFRP